MPGAARTPDDGISIGGAVLRYFRLDDPLPSRVGLTFATNFGPESAVSLEPQLWLAGRYGLGGVAKLSHQEQPYFGIGNDTPASAFERYEVLRVDGRIEAIRRFEGGFAVGLLHVLRVEEVREVEPDGELATGDVTGADGARLSGFGLVAQLDTRDNQFAPRSGVMVYLSPRFFHRAFGSELDFLRVVLDARAFVNPWRDHVIALDARMDLRAGDTPFDELAMAGGSRYLRGLLEGRFRDRHFLTAQAEYRLPIYWRIGGVAFAGLGRLAPRLGELADLRPRHLKYSIGGGLRYTVDRAERITVRADLARASGDTGVYVTLLEAF